LLFWEQFPSSCGMVLILQESSAVQDTCSLGSMGEISLWRKPLLWLILQGHSIWTRMLSCRFFGLGLRRPWATNNNISIIRKSIFDKHLFIMCYPFFKTGAIRIDYAFFHNLSRCLSKVNHFFLEG
jgi:hypothetical protein